MVVAGAVTACIVIAATAAAIAIIIAIGGPGTTSLPLQSSTTGAVARVAP